MATKEFYNFLWQPRNAISFDGNEGILSRENTSSRGPSIKRCSAEVWSPWTSPGALMRIQIEINKQ